MNNLSNYKQNQQKRNYSFSNHHHQLPGSRENFEPNNREGLATGSFSGQVRNHPLRTSFLGQQGFFRNDRSNLSRSLLERQEREPMLEQQFRSNHSRSFTEGAENREQPLEQQQQQFHNERSRSSMMDQQPQQLRSQFQHDRARMEQAEREQTQEQQQQLFRSAEERPMMPQQLRSQFHQDRARMEQAEREQSQEQQPQQLFRSAEERPRAEHSRLEQAVHIFKLISERRQQERQQQEKQLPALRGWFHHSPEQIINRSSTPHEARPRSPSPPWRGFDRASPDFSPDRNEVREQNPRATGLADANTNKPAYGVWRRGAAVHRSETTGPEQKRRRTMEPKKTTTTTTSLAEPRRRSSEVYIMQLPVSRRKWYLRYIAQGFSAEEALRMAKETLQPATAFNVEKWKGIASGGDKQTAPTAGAAKTAPPASAQQPLADSPTPEQQQDSKLKICLMPVGYPDKKLNHKEKIQLEEAIIEEVRISRNPRTAHAAPPPPPLRFSSVHYRLGYIEVRCYNQETVSWLFSCGSKLSTYTGPPIEVKQELIPEQLTHTISVYLPRSVTKSNEYICELLKAQNTLNIDMWQMIQRKDQGNGIVARFSIDEKSAADIAANDHKLFYRIGTVAVTGLDKPQAKPVMDTAATPQKNLTAGSKGSKPPAISTPNPMQENDIFLIDLASDNDDEPEVTIVEEPDTVIKKANAVEKVDSTVQETPNNLEKTAAEMKPDTDDEPMPLQENYTVAESNVEQAQEVIVVDKPLEEKNPMKEEQQTVEERKLIEASKILEEKGANKENMMPKNATDAAQSAEMAC